jgi:hypothetical protein
VAKNKIRNGFDDVKSYCEFDIKCHGKLHALSKVMENIGKYGMKNSMTQWFSNAL